MTHLGLKISLMEQNKFNKYFLILISFFLICGCQFDWIEQRHVYLKKIEFGASIKNSFVQKSTKYFSIDPTSSNYHLKIIDLQFKKKNYYGGSAARSKQIEITGELEYSLSSITSNQKATLQISGSIPINEANPQAEIMAQRALIEELEVLLLEDLIEEYWLVES